MKRGFSAERLLPFAAFGGALLLLASQFMPIFELRSAGDVVQATVTSTDQHWLSMGLFAILAAAAIFGAIWTGSRPLAFTVATCGLVALLLFLLIDLPDAGRTDSVATSAEALIIAEAHPAGGFWIELIGALVLTVCGGAMATLSGEQLRALRPQLRRSAVSTKPTRGGRPPASPAPEAQSSSQGKPKSSPRAGSKDRERAGGRDALQDTAGGRGASKDGGRGGGGGGSPQRKVASSPKAKAAAKTGPKAKPKPRPKAAAKAKPKAKAPSATPNGNPGAEGSGPDEEAQREERRAKRAARRAEEQAKEA